MKTLPECPKCHIKLTKQQIGTGIHDCKPPKKAKSSTQPTAPGANVDDK